MNSVTSMTTNQMLEKAAIVGVGCVGFSFALTFGVLSARSVVRIVLHWNEYPPEAKKIRALVGNIFLTVSYVALAMCYGHWLALKIVPGLALLKRLSSAIDIAFAGGFLCFVAGAAITGVGKNAMPNMNLELEHWLADRSFLPMRARGYRPQPRT